MQLDELKSALNKVQWINIEKPKEVDLALEEDFLVQTLKDMADTSWGRDTLDYDTIKKWLDNFTGQLYKSKYEKILALILAVHMVYYNERDVCHLVRLAYRKIIHEIMDKERVDVSAAAESMAFLPLGTVSESGPFLSYYFRKENCLPTESFVYSLDDIGNRNPAPNIILLDDVSISGGQVDWYIREKKRKGPFYREILSGTNIYALFLISTTEAKEKLKQHGVKLCTPIMMDERSRCFAEESSIYKIFDRSIRDVVRIQSKTLAQYYGCKILSRQYMRNGEFLRILSKNRELSDDKIIEKVVKKMKNDALGYNNAQALIAFEYNTPNNTLPIIWADDNQWNSLFKRYDKLYSRKIMRGIENENIFI